eukprot:14693259-Heterocapsa_arctica.AAC.1
MTLWFSRSLIQRHRPGIMLDQLGWKCARSFSGTRCSHERQSKRYWARRDDDRNDTIGVGAVATE